MTTPPPRVRVTGPARRPIVSPRRGAGEEIDADTSLGELYVGSLLRAQLRLAVTVLLGLTISLGSLPLVFHLAPGLAQTRVQGVPLAFLILGFAVYPFLLAVGGAYVWRAERNEMAFTALLDAGPEDDEPR